MLDDVVRMQSELRQLEKITHAKLYNKHLKDIDAIHREFADLYDQMDLGMRFKRKRIVTTPFVCPSVDDELDKVDNNNKKPRIVETTKEKLENAVVKDVLAAPNDSKASKTKPITTKTMEKKMVKRLVTVKKRVKRMQTVMRPKVREKKQKKPTKPIIDVSSMKVVELKAELKKRGLKLSGVKAVLAKRLTEAIDAEAAEGAESEEEDDVVEMEEVEEEVEDEIEEQVEMDVEIEVEVDQEEQKDEIVEQHRKDDQKMDGNFSAETDSLSIESIKPATTLEEAPLHESNRENKGIEDTATSIEVATGNEDSAAGDEPVENHEEDSVEPDSDEPMREKPAAATSGDHVDEKVDGDMVEAEADAHTPAAEEAREHAQTHDEVANEVVTNALDVSLHGIEDDEIVRESTETFSQFSQAYSPYKPADQIKNEDPVPHEDAKDYVAIDDDAVIAHDHQDGAMDNVVALDAAEPNKEVKSCQEPAATNDIPDLDQDQTEETAPEDDKQDFCMDREDVLTEENVTVDRPYEPATADIEMEPQRPVQQESTDAIMENANEAEVVEVKEEDPIVSTALQAERTHQAIQNKRNSSIVSIPCAQADMDDGEFVGESQVDVEHTQPLLDETNKQEESSGRISCGLKVSFEHEKEERTSTSSHTYVSVSTPTATKLTEEEEKDLKASDTTTFDLTTPSPVNISVDQKTPMEQDTAAALKRKEQQEHIQREAQRLRMAAKQSAKKRLEEAKASSLFWAKREQMKLQMQASAATPTASSATALTTESTVFTAESSLAVPVSEAKQSEVAEVEKPTIEMTKPEPRENKAEDEIKMNEDENSDKPTTKKTVEKVDNTSDFSDSQETTARTGRTTATSSSTSGSTKQPSKGFTRRTDSISSTRSIASSVSSGVSGTSDHSAKSAATTSSNGQQRKPLNLVSGLHSFTSLIEKENSQSTINLSQGSTTSSSQTRTVPVVNALKLAEKSRLLEQKKNLDKQKRKEALMRKYEEQRKLDEEKKKKMAMLKEKAEREARLKREQEKEKKQREVDLAKKRQQKLLEMRAGLEKKRAQLAADREATTKATASTSTSTAASRTATAVKTAAPAPSTAAPQPSGKVEKQEETNYEMSDNGESESEQSVNSEDEDRHPTKNIPKWAQREHLEKALGAQFGPNAVDPTPSIFPDFVDTCDLEAIFQPTDIKKKKKFAKRTSSGNWLADRPTAREKAMYKREMGFHR